MKTAGLVALFVLAFASSVSARTALKDTITDANAGDYPTYDIDNAERKADDCYSLFVGRNGDRIPANADKEEIISGFHNCLAAGGLRYGTGLATQIEEKIGNLADAKAKLIVDIGKRLNALLALDISVDKAEGGVEEGFNAADLDSLATPLDAQDSVLKRGGQRAEEALSSEKSAESLKSLIATIQTGNFATSAGDVVTEQSAVNSASSLLATAKKTMDTTWASAKTTILNNYKEVQGPTDGANADNKRQRVSTSGEACFIDGDCADDDSIECRGQSLFTDEDKTAFNGTLIGETGSDDEFDIDYGTSTAGICSSLATEANTSAAEGAECPTGKQMFKLQELDTFVSDLVGVAYGEYSDQVNNIVDAAGGFVDNKDTAYCASKNTNLGRLAEIEAQKDSNQGPASAGAVVNTLFDNANDNESDDATYYKCTAGLVGVADGATATVGDYSGDLKDALTDIADLIKGTGAAVAGTVTLGDDQRINNTEVVLGSLLDSFKSDNANVTSPELMGFKRAVLAESVYKFIDNVDKDIKRRCGNIATANGGSDLQSTLTEKQALALVEALRVRDAIYDAEADADCTASASDPSVFSLDDMALANDTPCSSAQLEALAGAVDTAIDQTYLDAMAAFCAAAKACTGNDCTLAADEGTAVAYQSYIVLTETVGEWDESVNGYTNLNRLDKLSAATNAKLILEC